MEYLVYIFAAITGFMVSFFGIPSIIVITRKKSLYDYPDFRKLHAFKKPTLGGLGIFAGFIFSLFFWSAWLGLSITPAYYFAHASLFILFFIGIKDDIAPLSAYKKFIGQLIAAGVTVFLADIRIQSLYGLFNVYEINYVVSVTISMFLFVYIINSLNFIDGIDGLAGSISFLASVSFGVFFLIAGNPYYSLISFAVSGAILGFLFYNIEPSQIFMGDTGSLILGQLLSILSIECINNISLLNTGSIKFSPLFFLCLLIVPVIDTLRIFVFRLRKGNSPFKPDQNHIHHQLIKCGFSHTSTVVILCLFTLAFALGSFFIAGLSLNLQLLIVLVISISLGQLPKLVLRMKSK